MDFLKNLKIEHWWTLLAVAGAAIAVASIPVRFTPGFPIGLGLLSCGIGESINHPRQSQKETVEGLRGFRVVDAYPWKPSIVGSVLDGIGVVLIGFGIYLLVRSL